MSKAAYFSACRRYRYTLKRTWSHSGSDNFPHGAGYLMVIGLNPSTADHIDDDPTIRRCIRFARDWGYGELVMTNLFAYRATKPMDLMVAADPVGGENDAVLQSCAAQASLVLAAWGNYGNFQSRDKAVLSLLPQQVPVFCLKKTNGGNPWHPLYVPAATKPFLYLPGSG